MGQVTILRTPQTLHLCLRDEITLPVSFRVEGHCLEPEVTVLDEGMAEKGLEVLVKIPVVMRIVAEAEGRDAIPPVEFHTTLSGRVHLGDSFTAAQKLQLALPIFVTARLDVEVNKVRPLGDPQRRIVSAWHSDGT